MNGNILMLLISILKKRESSVTACATSGHVHVVICSTCPKKDMYGFDSISARSSFVLNNCIFDNFKPGPHGLTTPLAFSWWNLLALSLMYRVCWILIVLLLGLDRSPCPENCWPAQFLHLERVLERFFHTLCFFALLGTDDHFVNMQMW